MQLIVFAFEIEDYPNNRATDFILDNELINGIGDVVHEYIQNPAGFSKLPLANLSEPHNCKLIYYAPVIEGLPSIVDCQESAHMIFADLERPFDLMVIDETNLRKLMIHSEIDFHYDLLTKKAIFIKHFE